jgi:GxxExxY protein
MTTVTKFDQEARREGKQETGGLLELETLTGLIIGAAIEVHRRLGPGFLELVYENALVIELCQRGLAVEQQKEIIVRYNDIEVGKHRLDLFVEGMIVVDLKTVKSLDDVHFAIVRSQLRAVGRKHGLLLNFAGVKLEVRRVISSPRTEPETGT